MIEHIEVKNFNFGVTTHCLPTSNVWVIKKRNMLLGTILNSERWAGSESSLYLYL